MSGTDEKYVSPGISVQPLPSVEIVENGVGRSATPEELGLTLVDGEWVAL